MWVSEEGESPVTGGFKQEEVLSGQSVEWPGTRQQMLSEL